MVWVLGLAAAMAGGCARQQSGAGASARRHIHMKPNEPQYAQRSHVAIIWREVYDSTRISSTWQYFTREADDSSMYYLRYHVAGRSCSVPDCLLAHSVKATHNTPSTSVDRCR